MAKTQSKTKSVSNFWKPEKEGETLRGKFGGLLEGSWKGDPVFSMRIGESLVSLGAVLASYVRSNPKAFKVGADVAITYLGRKKRTKLFSVSVGGKLLTRDSDFSPAEISVDEYAKKTAKG